MTLPPLPQVKDIRNRLLLIFPEGTPNRGYCTREMAAKTVFVMLYMGAVENVGKFLRPDQVSRMTDIQAAKKDNDSRLSWAIDSLKERGDIPGRWYAVGSREPIRDETLRAGLIPTGAVGEKPDVATTSPAGRYYLRDSFAVLLDPALKGLRLKKAISAWQMTNLNAGALARIHLLAKGAVYSGTGVLVSFPNGETRRLSEGPSSVITKAVVEEFTKRFLTKAGVIFLSESRTKVLTRDNELANRIGLQIPADRSLPDILLVDLGPSDPLLVFVEVVATDGAITEQRKDAFLKITRAGGFNDSQVAFVTAYLDRTQPAFKKTVTELAWNAFAWFASEPNHLIVLRGGAENDSVRLADLCS